MGLSLAAVYFTEGGALSNRGLGAIGAKALAATLAGQRTEVVFPLMPVAVKTPALPMVVAPPAPGTTGPWINAEPGLWQFNDAQGLRRGFVLTGAQTPRRGEQAKQVVA